MSKDQTTDEWLNDLETADDVDVRDASDLRAIGEALEGIDRADAELVRAVAAARAAGRSWTEVANVLGVSRQAARQRFEAKVAASAADLVPAGKVVLAGLGGVGATTSKSKAHPKTTVSEKSRDSRTGRYVTDRYVDSRAATRPKGR